MTMPATNTPTRDREGEAREILNRIYNCNKDCVIHCRKHTYQTLEKGFADALRQAEERKWTRQELVEELIGKHGFKWGYVYGCGKEEPAGHGNFVIADVEKVNVLIAPEDQFKEPIPYHTYF